MDRDGAAKTYATYTRCDVSCASDMWPSVDLPKQLPKASSSPSLNGSWGYFNRRMWVRRQLKLDDALEQADVLPDPQQPMVEDTSYGESCLQKQHAAADDRDDYCSAPGACAASLCAAHIFMLMLAQGRPAPPGASSRPCHSSSASSERRRPAQWQTATSGSSNTTAVCQYVRQWAVFSSSQRAYPLKTGAVLMQGAFRRCRGRVHHHVGVLDSHV